MLNQPPCNTQPAPREAATMPAQALSLNLMLDFDGVLHPYEPCAPEIGAFRFDPPQLHPDVFCRLPYLENAIRLIEAGGVPVVIHLTTSWREVLPLERLRTFLGTYLGNRTAGMTSVESGLSRGDEVVRYLDQRGELTLPWIAVDDNSSLFESVMYLPGILERLFFVDDKTGFTEDDSQKLVAFASRISA